MCSSDKNQLQLKRINNDNLNVDTCLSSERSGSTSSGDDQPIDLLKPRVKQNKLDTYSKSTISLNKTKYQYVRGGKGDEQREVEEGDDEDEGKDKFEEIRITEERSKALYCRKADVVRRKSGISFSDFQLRKSQIERLLQNPEETEEKNRTQLVAVNSSTNIKNLRENNYPLQKIRQNKRTDNFVTPNTHKENIHDYNNSCKDQLAGDSEYTNNACKLNEHHQKSADINLTDENLNKKVDRLLLRSLSRQGFHEESIVNQSSQSKFKCSRSKFSLIKQSDENTKEQNSEPTLNSNTNLLGLLLKRSESETDTSPSIYSTSPENLLCDNQSETERFRGTDKKYKKHLSRKRKPWTIQEDEIIKNQPDHTLSNIMYCGDSQQRSNLFSKYTTNLYEKENLFKHQIESKESKDAKRVFPFEATPSGNLKVGPKQVVFESKKVSVLVADPQRTKVNVKADVNAKTNPSTSGDRSTLTSMQLPSVPRDLLSRMPPMPPNRMPPGMGALMGRADGDFPNLSPPISFAGRSEENSSDETRADGKKHKHIPEMNLSRMGYCGKDQIDWNKISLPLKSDLHKLLHHRISNYINPDFIIQIGNHEYRCHLLVLQCYSSFFENIDKNIKSVDLSSKNITGEAFESLYAWMIHLGQDSYQLLRRDNILEMFMAAQYLGVKELEEQCWAFIDNEELFSEDTAFLLYLDARRLGHTAVMELMVPRIQRFFLTLVSSKDWLDLQVDEVTVFLRSNYICIHCEMEVFMSGVRWLMYDWPKRNIHLVDIMQCVRFGLIAPWQLVDIRRNPESPEFIEITKDADVQRMVEDGLAFAIIKYWYGHESADYSHWIDLLGLSEPASRNWAGTEKNYLMYKEFLADLENYRIAHNKALNEKKKSKLQLEDSDSLDEDTVTREHILQDTTGMSISQPSAQGNRKNQANVMQPPPLPPPIPTMVEFIARRGDQNAVSGKTTKR